MDYRGLSDRESRRRHGTNSTMEPSYPDARPGPIGVTIAHIHAAVKYSHDSGGKGLRLQAGEQEILERECRGLGNCSRFAFNIVISPLQNVLVMLKGISNDLENWASRAKRMHYQRAALGIFHFPYSVSSLAITNARYQIVFPATTTSRPTKSSGRSAISSTTTSAC